MSLAVVVIDMQQALFQDAPRPFEATEVVARINALTARARSTRVPVVMVQHETQKPPMLHGSAGWELLPDIVTTAQDILIRKTTPDSFLRTGLDATLKDRGVSELIVCGYASEFCVDTTVRSAAAHGYPVTLAADAHTTHDKAHLRAVGIREHENNTLPDITSFGVPISAIPVVAVLQKLQG